MLRMGGEQGASRRRLPFGSEFSPDQVSMPWLLQTAVRLGGDAAAFEAAVRAEYFEARCTSEENKGILAMNTRLSLGAYGILDQEAQLTDFGRKLYAEREHEQRLYNDLARHILTRLHGVAVLECVRNMAAAGERVTPAGLSRRLAERRVDFPANGRHASALRLWLERAGVIRGDGWRIDEDRLATLLGATDEDVGALAGLSREQRAYLRAFVNAGLDEPQAPKEVARLAQETYSVPFDATNLVARVVHPLVEAGLLEAEPGIGARGARAHRVAATEKLRSAVAPALLAQAEAGLRADLRPLVRLPLETILERVGSADRHVRGLTLEALAFKLMRLIDLHYVSTRLGGDATGGGEVDLIFEAERLVHSRWQLQCRHTERVCVDDVAREVGLTYECRGSVVLVLSTGGIGSDAQQYASLVREKLSTRVCLVGGDTLRSLSASPTRFLDVLSAQEPTVLTTREGYSFR